MSALRPSGLPIDEVLPQLTAALRSASRVVLQAPPGAGKSTVVPLVLLNEPWSARRRILMLEPRRLATRAVAARMAQTLGEPLGRTVGYRMRLDTQVSRETRIEVVTEGVLTRMLQSDPALEGVAVVIFDEFHERSLQADLGLALAADAQAQLQPALKLLVMSATLDAAAIAARLGGAPVVISEGRSFPVETRYVGRGAPLLPEGVGAVSGAAARTAAGRAGQSLEGLTARTVERALREESGDVLVFLPGAREIRRVQSLLQAAELPAATRVLPLFGELPPAEQEAALGPAPAGARKVVLATNIAETSLTIEGVRIVVDAGVERRSLFDPVTGMSRLETLRISRAAADQRRGRAGRLAAGVCYRLWSEPAQRSLAPFATAQILETDLTALALELAAWGTDATALTWLDPPPPAMLAGARDLLGRLGALDGSGRITPHGREMVRLRTHPRLAHMLLQARALGCVRLAADLAALLSERDLLRAAGGTRDADVRSRLALLHGAGGADVDPGAMQRARRAAEDLLRQSGAGERGGGEIRAAGAVGPGAGADIAAGSGARDGAGAGARAAAGFRSAAATGVGAADDPDRRREGGREGLLLAFAYPDRIALRRPGGEGRYLLANGRGATFKEAQSLGQQELIVAIDLDDRDRDARILLAAPLERADLERHFAARLKVAEAVQWSEREQAVTGRRVVRLDALELSDKPLPEVPPEAALAALLRGVRQMGIGALPWNDEVRELQARMEFVRARMEDTAAGGAPEAAATSASASVHWPAVDDASLAGELERWLAPWLNGMTRREHLSRLPLEQALLGLLSRPQQLKLAELAPTHLTVPTGSRIRIDYRDELAPVVAVRLQEVFGLTQTPRIAQGRVPVTFRLLSPAQRPVQVTRDLAGFWRGSYAEVRKDMRGRYPRHHWPEDPAVAAPTRRPKPRR